VIERIHGQFARLSAASTTEWVDSYGQGRLVEAFARFLGLFAILIVTLSEANVLQMSVSERLQDLAVLRALGWSRLRVAGQVFGEGLLVTTVGGLSAIPLSNVLLYAFSTIDPATFNAAGVLPAGLSWAIAFEGLVVSLLAGLIGSLGPLVRALRLDPARALRAL
jgi:putative ABC transport system permease protein